jgi:hypothetical protein
MTMKTSTLSVVCTSFLAASLATACSEEAPPTEPEIAGSWAQQTFVNVDASESAEERIAVAWLQLGEAEGVGPWHGTAELEIARVLWLRDEDGNVRLDEEGNPLSEVVGTYLYEGVWSASADDVTLDHGTDFVVNLDCVTNGCYDHNAQGYPWRPMLYLSCWGNGKIVECDPGVDEDYLFARR